MGRFLSAVALLALLVTGCNINRNIMFKTPLDYKFDTVQDSLDPQFKIQANDMITFRLYSNDGFKMVDLIDENGAALRASGRMVFNYIVDYDGRTKLPVIGMTKVAGLTIRQAELMLEEKYSQYYQSPFVQLTVGNRRVIVFPGGGGDAQVVPLDNNNTTLLEVLASAGGVAGRGDARKVKVFRRNPEGGRKVYMFDLSDISGLKYGDLVMQADDVVYVHPNPEIARELISNINPIITLLTTTLLVVGIVNSLAK